MSRAHESIKDLLSKINRGELVLPDLQREFVWRDEQIRDFANSLYKDYPIGIIILWDTPGQSIPTIMLNETQSPEKIRSVVLDGQQRLSSALMLSEGTIRPERGTARDCNVVFDANRETFELRKDRTSLKFGEYWVPDIVKKGPFELVRADASKAGLTDNDKRVFEIAERVERARNRLTEYQVPVHTLPSALEYADASEIFLKVNSQGTKIRATELLLALLSVRAPRKLKDQVYELEDELESDHWGDIDISILIRIMFGAASGQARLRASASKEKIKKLTEEEVLQQWQSARRGFMETKRLLESSLNFRSSRWIPQQLVLVPISVFMALSGGKYSPTEGRRLLLWYLMASLYSRYTGTTEPRLEEDIAPIFAGRGIGHLFKNLHGQRGSLRVTKELLDQRTEAVILNLYALERDRKAVDWAKGHQITDSAFEIHHIFPKKVLRDLDVNPDLINHVGNLTLITGTANKDIRTKEPSKYLPSLGPDRLANHFIPSDESLWKSKSYEGFLRERTKLLVKGLNEFYEELGLGAVKKEQGLR